jgi:hypothetical protein
MIEPFLHWAWIGGQALYWLFLKCPSWKEQSIRSGQLGRTASERYGILTIMAILAKIVIRGAEYGPRPCVACR